MGDNGLILCSIVIPVSRFAVIHPDLSKSLVVLTFTTPRNSSELKFMHCAERIDIHIIFYSFHREKELLTEGSDVWPSSP